MSFLPSVECGKFKLKKAFQSGKTLACTKKSKICVISTLKLIKMMLKCQVAYKPLPHACFIRICLRDFNLYFALFCFVPWSKGGGGAWHNALPLNTLLDRDGNRSGCRSGRDFSTGRSSRSKNRSNSPFWQLKDI